MPTIVNIFTSCAKSQFVAMKKTLLILLFMGLANVLVSCLNTCGPFPEFFNIKELAIEFGRVGETNTFVQTTGPLSYDKAAFNLTVQDSEVISSKDDFPSLFNNMLYACDPAPTKSKQKITSLEISSSSPLYFETKIIAADENIAKYFTIQNAYTIDEFLLKIPVFADNYDNIIFQLNTPPDSTINQPFTFRIELDDGKAFDLNVDHVRILQP